MSIHFGGRGPGHLSRIKGGALARADFTLGALPDWLSFSRAGNATNFNSAGNLVYAPNNGLLYSSTFTNANWIAVGGSAGSAATDPNGGTNAYPFVEDGSTGGHSFVQNPTASAAVGQIYQHQIVIKAGTRSWAAIAVQDTVVANRVWFNISTGAVGTTNGTVLGSGIISLGGGWYQILVAAAVGTAGALSFRISAGSADNTASYTGVNGNTAFTVAFAQSMQITAAQQSAVQTYNPTTSAAYYGPRFDYDPSTLAAKGLLLEGARTNSIRNNTMQGAVAGTARVTGSSIAISRTASTTAVAVMATHNFSVGDLVTITGATGTNASEYNGTFVVSAVVPATSFSYVTSTSRTDSVTGAGVAGKSPGTLPTNFLVGGATGLAVVVDALGTVNGSPYINLRFAGLSSGTFLTLLFEQSQIITAAQNSVWNLSVYTARVGGTFTNITGFLLTIRSQNAAGGTLSDYSVDKLGSIGTTLSRIQTTQTAADATTAFVRPIMATSHTSGVQIDVTLQIVLDQMEAVTSSSQVASSPIPTTGSALTRAADIATLTGAAATVLSAAQGTALVETVQYINVPSGATGRLIAASSGGNSDMAIATSSGQLFTSNVSSQTLQESGTASTWATGGRGGLAWNAAGRSVKSTLGTLSTDTNAYTATGTFYLGGQNGSSNTADGWYSRAAFWNTRLPDATLSQKVILGTPL